jgi:hypothetical protein
MAMSIFVRRLHPLFAGEVSGVEIVRRQGRPTDNRHSLRGRV